MGSRLPVWTKAQLTAVCNVLAARDWPGLTGTEIGQHLAHLQIADVSPGASNKRSRLFDALAAKQNASQTSNYAVQFINAAMEPGEHLEDQPRFQALQDKLDEALSLVGYRVNDKGRVVRGAKAETLDEVAKLAGRLRAELTRRGVHAEVIRYCEDEIVRRSLFHAVFEASKGISERLRQLSGSTLDGGDLVDHCFGTKVPPPVIRINSFRSESEISEHKGFANLLKGIAGTFRNPPAHTPRAAAGWSITEPDALDLFSTLSLLHRRLDAAMITRRV